MTHPTYLRTEPAPRDSLLKGETVVYQWTDGRVYRCTPKEFARLCGEEKKERKST